MECFSNSLEEVPTFAEHMLAAFPSLCGPTNPNPSQLGCGQLIVEARSSDHSITLIGQIAHTQPGGVFWVPLSANQMGWRIAAECCGSHVG